MSNVNTDGLPPEMQQRIADIIEKAKSTAIQQAVPQELVVNQPAAQAPGPTQAAPNQSAVAVRPPSLMDHVIALRQEVQALREETAYARQQTEAAAQVTEAVGNAVGQLYNMFFQQSEAPTYSSSFQTQPQVAEDDY